MKQRKRKALQKRQNIMRQMPSEILGKKLILQFIGFAPSNSKMKQDKRSL